MAHRTLLIVALVCLAAVAAWSQARTEPAGEGPKPAMIVNGRVLAPAAFAAGLTGDTVHLDGVEMLWVGAAVKNAGGSATIEVTPEGKLLHTRSGMRSMDFVILPPGEFWRHPWVRYLIADAGLYQLQPMPWWPYVEANFPSQPPYTVEWRRPYLMWKPDEYWLLLHLNPPPPPEPEVMVVEKKEPTAGDEGAPAAAAPAAAPSPPMGEPGMAPGMPGMDPTMMPPPPP